MRSVAAPSGATRARSGEKEIRFAVVHRLHREPHVLAHGQATEDVGDLKRARDAEPGPLVRSEPRDVTCPRKNIAALALGGSAPPSRLKNVVLPAPFGPMIVRTPPAGNSIETSLTALKPAKSVWLKALGA